MFCILQCFLFMWVLDFLSAFTNFWHMCMVLLFFCIDVICPLHFFFVFSRCLLHFLICFYCCLFLFLRCSVFAGLQRAWSSFGRDEAVEKADFAHAIETMKLHERTESVSLEGVDIFHGVANQISMSSLNEIIEKQGFFQWLRVNASVEGKIEAFFIFVFSLAFLHIFMRFDLSFYLFFVV